MQQLPSPEEREWLVGALRTLLSRRAGLLDTAPLVEPTNDWFPEPWSATARHGHRLAQRMMHYAGLGGLHLSLSAYEPEWIDGEERPWDAGTAGWFAGIRDGRAHFGLHVDQFRDPEAAAGVLAHEVAHAWRAHHGLVEPDEGEEELLTDVTTVALGFGILSTNNTDRYRSSGTWDTTEWSMSSVGYLPPQAMAWLIALWSAARERPAETRLIERHLEPNQLAFFRMALQDLVSSPQSPRSLLSAEFPSSSKVTAAAIAPFTVREPSPHEIEEPPALSPEESNRGVMVYRKSRGGYFVHVWLGAVPGLAIGLVAGFMWLGTESTTGALLTGVAGAVAAGLFMLTRARRAVCSECGTEIDSEEAVCRGCSGTAGRRMTERELRRLREEELDRNAQRDIAFEECDRCEPERPCADHAG